MRLLLDQDVYAVTANAVHAELKRVLGLYSPDKLLASFVVVEPGQHRIRSLEA
jgi:hypothetical protein